MNPPATPAPASPWVLRIPAPKFHWVAPLRDAAGLEAAPSGDAIWIRGRGALTDPVQALPFDALYLLDPDTGRLTPPGKALPVRELPEALNWVPLADFLQPLRPAPVYPGTAPLGLSLERVRAAHTSGPLPANALRATAADWTAFCEAAPQPRLAPLRFCANAEGEVIIRGTPLPSIPGDPLVERSGIAVAAGCAWKPDLQPAVLRRYLGTTEADFALLHGDGTWERIDAIHFVPATRSAARLTSRCL